MQETPDSLRNRIISANEQLQTSRLNRLVSEKNEELQRLLVRNGQLVIENTQLRRRIAELTEDNVQLRDELVRNPYYSVDPEGHYYVLGINPILGRNLEPDRFDELLEAVHSAYARVYDPAHPNNTGTERIMAAVDAAYTFLKDSSNRESYGV